MKLVKTCNACPEQYDAFDDNGNQVGYLRLRHGVFTVNLYSPSGPEVYVAYPEGDGIFTSEERTKYLDAAVTAILINIPSPSPLQYSIEDSMDW